MDDDSIQRNRAKQTYQYYDPSSSSSSGWAPRDDITSGYDPETQGPFFLDPEEYNNLQQYNPYQHFNTSASYAQDGQHPLAGFDSPRYNADSLYDTLGEGDPRPYCGDDLKVRAHFVQEIQEYNPYVSYAENDQLPVPVWQLSEQEVQDFHNKHVIAKDRNRDEAYEIVDELLENNLDMIERGEGYEFNIPNFSKEHMEYNQEIGISLATAGHTKKRSFSHGNQRNAACRTAYTANQLGKALNSGLHISMRTLFYTNKDLFGDQSKSDQAINDICSLTKTRRGSMGVIAAERGMVLGNIYLELTNGKSISCSIGVQIPNKLDQIERVAVENGSPDIQYILVVEKHTMLTYLQEMDYHNINNCIILTGCGMPSIQTRDFLRFFKQHSGLPVFGLCDPDPKGVEILAVYARGSRNSAYDNFNISVPSLRWIGLSSLDMEKLNLPESSYIAFNSTDKNTLDSLLGDELPDDNPYKLSKKWLQRIRHMKRFSKKASFENIHSLGFDYFASTLLPEMINKAAGHSNAREPQEQEPQDTGASED